MFKKPLMGQTILTSRFVALWRRILTQEKIEFSVFGLYWKLGMESQPLYKIYPKPKCFFDMKQNVGPISRSKKQCNQQTHEWLAQEASRQGKQQEESRRVREKNSVNQVLSPG